MVQVVASEVYYSAVKEIAILLPVVHEKGHGAGGGEYLYAVYSIVMHVHTASASA